MRARLQTRRGLAYCEKGDALSGNLPLMPLHALRLASLFPRKILRVPGAVESFEERFLELIQRPGLGEESAFVSRAILCR